MTRRQRVLQDVALLGLAEAPSAPRVLVVDENCGAGSSITRSRPAIDVAPEGKREKRPRPQSITREPPC